MKKTRHFVNTEYAVFKYSLFADEQRQSIIAEDSILHI